MSIELPVSSGRARPTEIADESGLETATRPVQGALSLSVPDLSRRVSAVVSMGCGPAATAACPQYVFSKHLGERTGAIETSLDG
jgi:hypothetical protein